MYAIVKITVNRISIDFIHIFYFIDIDLLLANEITKIIPEKDVVLWLFSSEVVKELLYDNVDFTNIVLQAIENMKISTDHD